MADTTYTQLGRLGGAVRAGRRRLKLSQEDFAERCGMHRTYLGEIERGEANVTFESITKVARGLGVRPSELFAAARL